MGLFRWIRNLFGSKQSRRGRAQPPKSPPSTGSVDVGWHAPETEPPPEVSQQPPPVDEPPIAPPVVQPPVAQPPVAEPPIQQPPPSVAQPPIAQPPVAPPIAQPPIAQPPAEPESPVAPITPVAPEQPTRPVSPVTPEPPVAQPPAEPPAPQPPAGPSAPTPQAPQAQDDSEKTTEEPDLTDALSQIADQFRELVGESGLQDASANLKDAIEQISDQLRNAFEQGEVEDDLDEDDEDDFDDEDLDDDFDDDLDEDDEDDFDDEDLDDFEEDEGDLEGESLDEDTGEAAQTPSEEPKPATASRSKTINLEAADFLPIEREDLKSGATANQGWGNPWFGRRDVIPPAEDERTKLIDRGMVTQGLLTPEQLVEIHNIGAEMQRLRPALLGIETEVFQAGQAAVEADRERREEIKKQKKKEAEERKKRRAEEIAHRHATDITFLGRGVSGRLNDRQSDAARLTTQGLPVLSTPAELATALDLKVPKLRWLAFHTEVATRIHYVHFTVQKKSGGERMLSAPHKHLATAQKWILDNILAKLPVESAAHGFLPGRSILTNAQAHSGKAVLINMDLEGFFPSISFPRVRSVFQRLGYSPAVATILALLCTECPRRKVEYDGQIYYVATGPRGLPQGACTSPALSNQVARRLDKRLTGLATRMGLTYTRYADDLSLSGDESLQNRVGYVMARVRHIAQDERFAVNTKKTRVLRRSTAQVVTGLVVNDHPTLSRKQLRRLRAILHRAQTEGLDEQNREGRPNFRQWLRGMVAYVRMVRPELGERMLQQLNAVDK